MARYFKSIDAVKRHVSSLGINSTLRGIDGFEADIIRKVFIPVLGSSYENHLAEAFTNDSLTDMEQGLIEHLQAALANYIFALIAKDGGLEIDDNGVSSREGGGRKQPYQWRVRNYVEVRDDAANSGMALLCDGLMDTFSDDSNTAWSQSAAGIAWRRMLIWSHYMFGEYQAIEGFETFMKFKPFMARAIKQIRLNIGSDFFDSVVVGSTDVGSEEYKLLDMMRGYIVSYSVSEATYVMPVKIGKSGLFVEEQNEGFNNDSKRTTPSGSKLYDLRRHNEQIADKNMRDLIAFLRENSSGTVYPLFFNSSFNSALDGSIDSINKGYEGNSFMM